MKKINTQKTIASSLIGLSSLTGIGMLALPMLASADTGTQYYYDSQGNYDADPVHAQSRMMQGSTNMGSWTQSYYPNAQPSSYYLMPTESLQIMGHGFAPNEQVMVSGNGTTMTMNADGSGNLSGQLMAAGMSMNTGMRYTYNVHGQQSGYNTNFTVEYGKYYPQIEPSSYYVAKGSSVHITGRNFAPNEQVMVRGNGNSMIINADGAGNVNTDVTAPGSEQSFTVEATGQYSQMNTSRTISVMQSW